MIDNENVLPLDGGEVPDDQVLKTRLEMGYRNVPLPEQGAVSRCVRMVLERYTAEHAMLRTVATGKSRRWMIAAAAVAAALLIAVTLRSRTPFGGGDTASAAPFATTTPIAGGMQFDLRLPKGLAANVSVVGDFNGWDATATPMVRDAKSGEWSAKITLLPGRHIYAYVVNGEKWIVDPLKPQIPDAGYGPANAVVVEEASK